MQQKNGTNLTWHFGKVTDQDRQVLLGHAGCVVWLTGLSGSGKSTIAHLLEEKLIRCGYLSFVLDGDNVRHGLNNDLGFSPEDRKENIRRIGEVASLFKNAGVIAITAFISPYITDRQIARNSAEDCGFIEVFLDTPVQVCEKRDPKGLYKKVRAGEISDFTGIDSPYERPENSEIILKTHQMPPKECAEIVFSYLQQQGILLKKKEL